MSKEVEERKRLKSELKEHFDELITTRRAKFIAYLENIINLPYNVLRGDSVVWWLHFVRESTTFPSDPEQQSVYLMVFKVFCINKVSDLNIEFVQYLLAFFDEPPN